MNNKPRTLDYINFANVITALSVVISHVNDCYWRFDPQPGSYWPSANVIECIFYFPVPVFFMITGATLMDFYDRYSLREYFSKRISRAVVPYILWSLIALAFRAFYMEDVALQGIDFYYLLTQLCTGQAIVIYWFFLPLFCAYLAIPLFAAVSKERRKEVFSYLAVVGFILNTLIPFIVKVFKLPVTGYLQVLVVGEYLNYVLIGYLLSHYELEAKYRRILYLVGLAGLMTHMVGSKVLSYRLGDIDKTFKGDLNAPCFVYAVAAFVFFKYWGSKVMEVPVVKKVVDLLKHYTFTLYLVHWYVIIVVLKEFGIDKTNLVYRLVAPPLIFVFVAGAAWLLRKIPLVKKYLLP